MISVQLERLQHDSSTLEDFIKALHKEGNYERAKKIILKKEYLDNRITEIMMTN